MPLLTNYPGPHFIVNLCYTIDVMDCNTLMLSESYFQCSPHMWIPDSYQLRFYINVMNEHRFVLREGHHYIFCSRSSRSIITWDTTNTSVFIRNFEVFQHNNQFFDFLDFSIHSLSLPHQKVFIIFQLSYLFFQFSYCIHTFLIQKIR